MPGRRHFAQEEPRIRDQMIDDHFVAQFIIVEWAVSVVTQDPVEMRMLGKLVHPMQPVDGERAVDHNAARHYIDAAKEVGIRATAQHGQILIVQEEPECVPAKTISRRWCTDPAAGVARVDEMSLGFDRSARAWQRPDSRSTFVDPPQETWTFSSSRSHEFTHVGDGADDHARTDGLNDI